MNLFLRAKEIFSKTLSCRTIPIILISVSLCFAEWISFYDGKVRSSVTTQDISKCTNITVMEMGCTISLSIPGAFRYGPGHLDQKLIKNGSSLSLYGSALGIVNINVNGTFQPEKLGQPNIPYARFRIRIPYSVTMDQLSVKVVNTDFRPIEGTYDIAPIQEQLWESFSPGVHTDNRVFQKDLTIYSKDAFYTHKLEYEMAICHGYKLLEIKYCPIKHNPVSKKLLATNRADVVLTYKEKPFTKYIEPNMFTNAIYRTTLDGITGKLKPEMVKLRREGKFVIVSGDPLINSQTLKDYISWRESQNYEHVKTLDAGSLSADDITDELKSLYSSDYIDFVLVVGDELVFDPPAKVDMGDNKYHYKDWSRLDGSDDKEDVCLGVLLCNDEDGLGRIIQRQKWHEAGGDWTETFINLAQAQDKENPMARHSGGHYATRNFDNPEGPFGYTVRRVYMVNVIPTEGYGGDYEIPGPFPWEPWVEAQQPWYTDDDEGLDKAYEYWNNGAFLIQHRGHGSSEGPVAPRIRMNDKITFTGSPLFNSMNCSSGDFYGNHNSNFSYLTQSGEIGTCGTISAAPVMYTSDNSLYVMGLYAGMFPEDGTPPERQIGMATIYAGNSAKEHSRTYMHLWGDALTYLSVGGVTGIVDNDQILLTPYKLKYDGSKIHFILPDNDLKYHTVSIELYNLQGKMIKTLVNGKFKPGHHSINLDNKLMLASGIYLCKMEGKDFIKTIEVLFNK